MKIRQKSPKTVYHEISKLSMNFAWIFGGFCVKVVFDIDEFKKLISQDKLIIINSPQNPRGVSVGRGLRGHSLRHLFWGGIASSGWWSPRPTVVCATWPPTHWSPDGSPIAFEYDRTQVAVMDAGGGPPPIIANKGSYNLSWSPDGKRIVIAPSQERLWLVNADGSGLTQIAQEGKQPS